MATVYKTPGAFIEEIPKFPPSVAQVETAIPAFIGYTEIADDIAPDDLLNKPRRIGSMVEFSHYYGGGPSLTVTDVNIDDSNNFKSATISSSFYMYDSLRLFFANGGGDCYIVSVGKYGAGSADADLLNGGIDTLMKEDVPTLLLFPDAVTLSSDGLYSVQQHALQHCADESRMDRFAIFDLKNGDELGTEFRNKVGINFLSYGAAYTPWLKTNLPKKVAFADVASKVKRNGASVSLKSLTPDAALQAQIDDVAAIYMDKNNIAAAVQLWAPDSLRGGYANLAGTINEAPTGANLKALMLYVKDIALHLVDDFVDPAVSNYLNNTTLRASLQSNLDGTFKGIVLRFIALDKAFKDATKGIYSGGAVGTSTFSGAAVWGSDLFTDAVVDPIFDTTTATDPEKALMGLNALNVVFDDLARSVLTLVVAAVNSSASTFDAGLEQSFPIYKNILRGISTYISNVPPSGAVAGIYAMVDSTRGVWKAPANVSLSNVIEPSFTFTKSDLDNLNVDVNAGKSINAIRSFFGKGTLVYGARTLAGNDNEWRYISVRRLFIMAEESIKKATEQFVFEPNDANTWVKVQAMIENFLHNIWRQGALQGAKPDHAFYVAVGLGKTMNPIDILEGRMIIEIGMAAVRPAEFIVLRFSHKMAES